MPTPNPQNEKLVTTAAAIRIDSGMPNRRWLEVQNLGPNPIYVSITTEPVLTKARRLAQYESWVLPVASMHRVYAIAGVADQVTGAATIVTELP